MLRLIVSTIVLSLFFAQTAFAQCRVYWIEDSDDSIRSSKRNGENLQTIFNGGALDGIAVAKNAERLYWNLGTQIYRSDLDGKNASVVYSASRAPTSIAVDEQKEKLYWTSIVSIERVNFDGSNHETLFLGDGVQRPLLPRNIQIDSAGGKIYWTEALGIYRSDLNGENEEHLTAGQGGISPRGLVLDLTNDLVFWGEAIDDEIRVSELDGSNTTVLVDGLEDLGTLTLSPGGTDLFFRDGNAIRSVNIVTRVITDFVTELAGNVLNIRAEPTNNAIVWASENELTIRTIGANEQRTLMAAASELRAIAVDDLVSQKIYFSSVGSGAILRTNLDGSGVELIQSGLGSPQGLAFRTSGLGFSNVTSRQLYWTDSERGVIETSPLAGGNSAQVISGLDEVIGIAIDSEAQRLYWSENSNSEGKIGLASLSGVPSPITLIAGLTEVNSLTIDPFAQRLFWTHMDSKISSADTLGGNLQTVLELPGQFLGSFLGQPPTFIPARPRGIVADVRTAKLYFADQIGPPRIAYTNHSGSISETIASSAGGNVSVPYGVALGGNTPEICETTDDYDNDNLFDYAVWRQAEGRWFLNVGAGLNNLISVQWGLPGDLPLVGNFDGEGARDLVVWRPSNGTWYNCYSAYDYDCSRGEAVQFGLPGDYPLVGDFDGDQISDFVVWRPQLGGLLGVWYIKFSSTTTLSARQWGLPGDLPVVGDFDGDGVSDFSVWRNDTGVWYVLLSGFGYAPHVALIRQWGLPGDHPFAADYDGDGKDDLVVWREGSGNWFVCGSANDFDCSAPTIQQFGLPIDVPVCGDFDNSGSDNFAVWRPELGPIFGTWYHYEPLTRSTTTRQWGLPNDIPLGAGIRDQVQVLYGG